MQQKQIRPGMFIFPGFILLLAAYTLLMYFYATLPGTLKYADFSSFYAAGRLAAGGHYGQVYDITAELGVEGSLLSTRLTPDQLLPFLHPPLLVPILQIVCSSNYLASYWRWTFIMVCLLVVSGWLMDRLLRVMGLGDKSRILYLVAILSFYPVFASLLKGQDTAFLILGGTVWIYGMIARKDSLAGLGLAMMIIRPQIAVMLAVPYLFNRRRVWWWFLGGAVGLALYSIALVGSDGTRDFIQLLVASAGGQFQKVNQSAMFNFTGGMLRLFPWMSGDPIHGLAWGLYLMGIIGLSVLWKISPRIRLWHLSLAVCLSIFAAPHLHYHDLALMVIPLLLVGIAVVMAGKLNFSWATGALIGISSGLLFGEWWDPMRLTLPFVLMVVIPSLTWSMGRSDG
jgi:hypothetical protein